MVQGELADGFGVDLDQAPEVFILAAEPPNNLVGIVAAAGCPGPRRGGGLITCSLAEVIDQMPVVAVEGSVRDAQASLDSGHSGRAAVVGGQGEDTRHDDADLVVGGRDRLMCPPAAAGRWLPERRSAR